MHGIVFAELKKFVVKTYGAAVWNELAARAGAGGKTYYPRGTYPDAEALALVSVASEMTGKPAQVLLEDFGEFIAPDLLGMYGAQVDPAWRTLDLIQHTEQTIHRVVRMRDPGAAPPELQCQRTSPSRLRLVYGSSRHMCGLAKGIARGVARHYGEQVRIEEPACMLKGSAACELLIEKVP